MGRPKNPNPVTMIRIHLQVNTEVIEHADALVEKIRAALPANFVGVRASAVSRAAVLEAALVKGLELLEHSQE